MRNTLSSIAMGIIFIHALVLSSCHTKDDTSDLPYTPVSLEEQLQKGLDRAIKDNGGKGVSLAVILPDGKVIRSVSGISHPGVPVHAGMVFSAGSITKTFTAALILKYYEEGKLSLEDSLAKWLPVFENIDGSITIRQLLNHTSGIYDLAESISLFEAIFEDPDKIWTKEEAVSDYVLVPYFDEGTGWHYSNTGYILLRMIIEKISGSTVAKEYRKYLIEPAGLLNTFCHVEESLPAESAYGWVDLNGDGYYDEMPADYLKSFYSIAGGGIFCTAEDLALWIRKLLHNQSIVKKESLLAMHEYHRPTPGEDLVDGYGLGLVKFNKNAVNGIEVCGHGGNPIGYAAGAFYLEDYGVCIGIMDNTEHGLAMPVIEEILTIIVDHINK